MQASLPDFPLAAEANAKGVIPDALQGGLNLAAGRGRPPKVHQGKFPLRGENTFLEFVGARLDSDSVSTTQLLAEFSQFAGKNSGELLGLSGYHVCFYAPRTLFRHVFSQSNGLSSNPIQPPETSKPNRYQRDLTGKYAAEIA